MKIAARQGATLDEIESVYRARLPEFRRVAAAILGDRELALDAVQEGFALAVRERATFRGEGTLEGWLWQIVVNAAKGHQRRSRDERELPDEPGARDNGQRDEPQERVRAAVALLPERQRLSSSFATTPTSTTARSLMLSGSARARSGRR